MKAIVYGIFLFSSALAVVEAFLPPKTQSQLAPRKTRLWVATSLDKDSSPSSADSKEKVDGLVREHAHEETDKEFNWFKNWYPLVPVEYLDVEIPHRFQLLGMDLVIWKDAPIEGGVFGSKKDRKKGAKRVGGEWRVFADECPHRKVPLSEGRVEDDGSLLCSYHAFRFNGEGELIDVPQLSEVDVDKIRSNPRSNCNSFPAQIVNGVLWVWPETGSDARIESALKEPAVYKLPDDVDESRIWYGNYNFRELPYSLDYFMENVVDGAHVEVAHHNIVGSRYKVKEMIMDYDSKLSKEGFVVKSKQSTLEDGKWGAYTKYQAPVLVTQEVSIDDEGSLQTLELYASPSRPGFCNHVGRMVIVKPKSGKMPALLKTFTAPIPKWLNHVLAAMFLNQDGVFLHYQERNLAKTGSYVSYKDGASSQQDFVRQMLPTETDRGVINYRTWLRKFAGGFIPYKNNLPLSPVDEEICFDQFKSHTSKCKTCQTALGNLKKARLVAFFISTCVAVLRPAPQKAVNLAAVLMTAGAGFGINKFIGMFHRYEFSHSHND